MSFSVAPGYPEELSKYGKMLQFGIPGHVVKQKLVQDGFEEDTFDKFLNPDTAVNTGTAGGPNDDGGAEDDSDSGSSADSWDANSDDAKQAEVHETGGGIDPLSLDAADPIPLTNEDETKDDEKTPMKNVCDFKATNFVPLPDTKLKMDALQPVPVKKTLLIVNTFIVNTAAFLNKFVARCDAKIHRIDTDIHKMESTLRILEAKLSSIDWLREAQAGHAPELPQLDDMRDVEFKVESNNHHNNNNQNNQKNDDGGGGGGAEEVIEAPAQPKEDPMISDPEYIPWFKMLKVGVPAPGVMNKMRANGYEEDVIEKLIQLHQSR